MPRQFIRIDSSPVLITRSRTLAGKRWMMLLASIEATQSIAAAAKAVGLSYKAAWDAVEGMNNLAGKPLVQRTKGGKGGGGTRVTPLAKQLISTFRAVDGENALFLKRLNSRIENLDNDLRILGRLTMVTSARNHFSGRVRRIVKGAINDEIELELLSGGPIVAIITHESLETLGLKKGSEAIALVKASSVLIAAGNKEEPKLSARNQLKGVISRLTPGAVNSEVVIELKGGSTVAAIITNASAKRMELAVGKQAAAIFKASSVILGV
jgi:molybdate transport system regulatory protein